MNDILEISKAVCFCLKWFIYIVAGIFIFLGVTQLVECFGVDAANKFAGMFTPLIVAVVTIYLSNRQHNIAEAQRDIAKVQAKTASNKLRLDLFDKRFDIYQNIIEIKSCIDDIDQSVDSLIRAKKLSELLFEETRGKVEIIIEERMISAKQKLKELESSLGKVRFLFNEISHINCREIIPYTYIYFDYVERKNITRTGSPDEYAINLYIGQINEIYRNILSNLHPYMDLSSIK